MRILVTNDDGIDSPGIWALAEAVSRVGEALIAAPGKQQSGVGTSISLHDGVDVAEVPSSIDGVRAYAVGGTPTDCVILALMQLVRGSVDLIVSGINTGANVGSGVLSSGTVMPTRVAHARGMPSFAVSLSTRGPKDQRELLFHLAGSVAEMLARRIAEGGMPPGVALNVNVPSVPRGETRGIVFTRLSSIIYWKMRTERGSDGLNYNRLFPIEEDDPRIERETDIWALNEGLVSVTPLRFDLTDHGAIEELGRQAPDLESALRQTVEAE